MKKNNKAQMRKILNFLNTDSFLSEYIYKKGRVFICSSDLSSDNNNFVNDKWPKLTIKLLNIFNLVKKWCTTGNCIVGHISNWDVSNVTNMNNMF